MREIIVVSMMMGKIGIKLKHLPKLHVHVIQYNDKNVHIWPRYKLMDM